MDLDFLKDLAGLAAFVIGGANFVIAVVAKTFWNLTFKRLEQEVAVLKEAERKNSIVRHDFTNVTNSVYAKMEKLESTLTAAIDTGFNHVKELFGKEVDNIHRRFDEKR